MDKKIAGVWGERPEQQLNYPMFMDSEFYRIKHAIAAQQRKANRRRRRQRIEAIL